MTIGMSIFLIAAGAILKYAVTAEVDWIDLEVVGTILMVVGILGLIISILYMVMWRDRAAAGPYDPPPPPRNRY